MGQYSQDGRKFKVETPLGPDVLLLERFSGEEAVSTPFSFTLHMVSEDPAIDAGALLRQPVCVTMEIPGGGTRLVHGRVRRFAQLGRSAGDGLVSYEAEVVPWLWFLALATDSRIFQGKSVPDIVKAVFDDLGLQDVRFALTGSYAPRDYCVQYRETHLDFVSRLMEEEGIFYFFEHARDKHTLVLADGASAIKPCPGQATARFMPQAGPELAEDVVLGVSLQHSAETGKVALRDFNFLTPSANLETAIAGHAPEERYDYPGGYADRGAGERYARLALDAHEAGRELLLGSGTCRAFVTGHRVGLADHYRGDANKQWHILRVVHQGTSGGFGSGRGDDASDYQNTFECIPHAVAYRPPAVTPRPAVRGSQTAIVVGPGGEEIYVDKYGRVKVQFHWDRLGKKNEGSSCWVRVASTWAGKNWGFIAIPRIGQEVVVDFLEGDPDQPIITGRVYNAEQMPPYDLPANKTQTGIKTRSTTGGGTANFNELRFEDKKGAEQIYIHAEKDKQVVVENDRTESVGHDESISIGNDRTESVGKDETISIGENRSEDVGKDETVSIGANQSLTVGKNQTTSVGADQSLDVGKKRDVSVGADESITIGASQKVQVGKDGTVQIGKKYVLQAGDEITLKTGDASITMKKDGTITIKGKDITINGSGKINVKASSDVVIKGSKVAAN